jgi:hypothetical protein
MIDPANSFNDVCKPFTEIPAWWSGFLFHVLNTRQLSVYLYLSMLADGTGTCHPTTNQIRQDLGLSSLTIIFDAMSVLETYGFVLRRRQAVPGSNSRRNVYQRPSCEFTVLRLLQTERLDGRLRPAPGSVNEMSGDARRLRDEWLRNSLGVHYALYESAPDEAKRGVLIEILQALLARPGEASDASS